MRTLLPLFSALLFCLFTPKVLAATPGGTGAVFLSDARIVAIQQRLASHDPVTTKAHAALVAKVTPLLKAKPQTPARWYVPGYYRDAAGHVSAKEGLATDANGAYGLALLYRISGDERYALAAAARIDAWSRLTDVSREDDSLLSFSYHFPAMVFAADLLRKWKGWPEQSRAAFSVFLRSRAMPMHTMARHNNWGSWGLVLWSACAAYLDDTTALETGAARYREFIRDQIAEDGHLPLEVIRNNGVGERGLWYTHFSLMPLTLAAEILHNRGIEVYDYVAPNGRTLRLAFERSVPWTVKPETFPYFKPHSPEERQLEFDYVSYWELLNGRWPNASATEWLKLNRSMSATHSAPFLSLTHGMR